MPLPTTMTKLLALGVPLPAVLSAVTDAPARAIGWGDRIGHLTPGRAADIAVLAVEDGPVTLRDSVGGTLRAERRILARHTIRGGVPAEAPLA